MASSSKIVAAAGTTYQVFLSFRGPDTRQGFTDVLYHALVDAGVRVFRDNEEIRKGEEIGGEIMRAIEESGIFVPIFSKGYASSKRCLLELSKMVELKEGSSGKKILPIFYDVGVDDVKLKTDMYSKPLEEHSKKFSTETVKLWEEALRQAGKFKGWELKDKGHAEFAKLVVRDVSMKLKVKHKCVTEYLVQRDGQMEDLMKLLDCDSPEVLFVGISGMGGIGKTTLARVVFNKLCDRFDGCSFLANVRESSGQHKGIESLQKQLLESLGIGSGDIMDVGDGIIRLRATLGSKKVLIVLDDVDSKDQIHNLAGNASWFGPGTRVFITTRDQSVLEIRRLGIQTLEVEELKPEEANRLFCMHAFGEDSPPDDYLSLSKEAVQSTGGLPLALAVIGSFLGDKPRQEWPDTIERLKKVPHKDVQKQLMISYEALSHESKQIFLDIACFFIGHEEGYPIYMWQACGFNPGKGLEELIYISLVKVIEEEDESQKDGKRRTLWMHDQLRDLGRAIVDRKSFEDGVKPSRLCFHDDASEMLHGEEGNEQVEMLRFHCRYTFTQKEISSLRKLRYLDCYGAIFSSELTSMLPKLRWLSWSWCPREFMGTGIFFRNLVILDLSCSFIDDHWSGWLQIGVGTTLKVLDLSECDRLTRTPDLSAYSSLERLVLKGCSNLVEIDPSIGKVAGLRHLSLACCHRLKVLPDTLGGMKSLVELDLSETGVAELPDAIGQLEKLEILSLRFCCTLKKLPISIGNVKSLVELDISHTGITKLPYSFGNLENLRVIKICRSEFKELPPSFGILRRLEELDASWTPLEGLPYSIGNLENLRVINMSHTGIKVLPSSFGELKRLEELDASWTPLEDFFFTFEDLTCLRVLRLEWTHLCLLPPKLPPGLTDVDIQSRSKLERVPEFSNLQNLVRLVLWDNFYRSESSKVRPIKLQGIGKLRRLVKLKLGLWNVTCIPEELSSLPQLQKLTLQCPNLRYCPPLPSTLSHLFLRGYGEMIELPQLSNLKSLLTLELCVCSIREDVDGNLGVGELKSLTSLFISNCMFGNPNVLRLPLNLRELNIWYCESLEALPALSHLKKLKMLSICGAGKLVEIPGLGELDSLQKLSIRTCDSVETLPDMSKLKMLRSIDILDCRKFKGINDICELESLEYLRIISCDCEHVDIKLPRKTREESRKQPFEDLYRDG